MIIIIACFIAGLLLWRMDAILPALPVLLLGGLMAGTEWMDNTPPSPPTTWLDNAEPSASGLLAIVSILSPWSFIILMPLVIGGWFALMGILRLIKSIA